jgi:hypothetical protein
MSQRRKIAIAYTFAVPVATMEINGTPLNPVLPTLIDIQGKFI